MSRGRICRAGAWLLAAALAATAAAQTTIQWQAAVSGNWFTASNWSPAIVPDFASPNSYRAVIAAAGPGYTVTASGSNSVDVVGLDVSSSGASVLFNFATSSFGLNLGAGTSSWTAGNVEFRTGSGISGAGTAATTLAISSGVELLFSASTGTRTLGSLNLNNSGTVRATSGTLSLSNLSLNNQIGGLIHADGAEIVFQSTATLANNGTLRATGTGGILRFAGTMSTANLGAVELVSGGRARLAGTLNNTGATLPAPSGGSFELFGTIIGGTIGSGALTFSTSNGRLEGVNLTGVLNLGANTFADFYGANTLTGSNVTFGSNSAFSIDQPNTTLAIDAASTATGNLQIAAVNSTGTVVTNFGSLTHTTGTGWLSARTFTNSGSITATGGTLDVGYNFQELATINSATGTITATGSGTTINLIGNVANSGTLVAQNSGTLVFQGSNVTANLGNVQIATGGRAQLAGFLFNADATLTAPTGGSFELVGSFSGSTILGGAIFGGTIGSGALTFTTSGGLLSGVNLTGVLDLGANTFADLGGGANTMTGSNITFGPNSSLRLNFINSALTIDAASTATGNLSISANTSTGTAVTNFGSLTHNSGTGALNARTFTNSGSITATAGTLNVGSTNVGFSTLNSPTGTMTADGSGATIKLVGAFTNSGTLVAQNSGLLIFQNNNVTASLGNVHLSNGGRAQLNGTFTNTAQTLIAPVGGSFELNGGRIIGGTIGSGALTFTINGGRLDGVTLAGLLNLGDGTDATLTGTNAFNESNVTFGLFSLMKLDDGAALTVDTGSQLTGNVRIHGGAQATTLTNQGSITHTLSEGVLAANAFTNSGSITASEGLLHIGIQTAHYTGLYLSTGTITSAGGDIFLNNPLTNEGLIRVQSGTLTNVGQLTNLPGGTITGAGTINNPLLIGGLTLAGGTLAPGNSIGTLSLVGGTFNVTAPTIFEFELGGSTSDALVFTNPAAPVDLGAGLVTLSLTLLSAPTLDTTYDLIRISSGGSGITGTFAGLPTSGSMLTANFSGTPYQFAINYQTNAITLQSIPEPGTCVLIGLGLVAMFMMRRRSRG